jgi:hypothetical protein
VSVGHGAALEELTRAPIGVAVDAGGSQRPEIRQGVERVVSGHDAEKLNVAQDGAHCPISTPVRP